MKIKTKRLSFDKVKKLKKPVHKKPKKPWFIMQLLVNVLSRLELRKLQFNCVYKDGFKFEKQPYLILMNHSSFIDLKIASKILFPKRYSIISTVDAFVGKKWLMEKIGCIPTQKFVRDITLIKDIEYALKRNKVSVLMYPEAGYSFDGTKTALPENFARLIKLLNVPVCMIKTDGAFLYDPLYNGLQLRNVPISCEVSLLFSKEDTQNLSLEKINGDISKAFDFDAFKSQLENKIEVNEPFRADGLERILYKCPNCKSEGTTVGKGVKFYCKNCNKEYDFTTLGQLKAKDGNTEFSHIPSYYNWERECVKNEILSNNYQVDVKVDIAVIRNFSYLYMVGSGTLTHSENGFTLKSDDGLINYTQSPLHSYTLNSDYYWYEIGDMVSIGNKEALFYCFFKTPISVTKMRLATEEIYKIKSKELSNK